MRRLIIQKQQLASTEIENNAEQPLNEGEARLSIDSFGLSANNITYAVLGDSFGYWGFFPAQEGWGVMPVWGFATVTESLCPELATGTRVFGYLPCADSLVVVPDQVNDQGFMDSNPLRKSISPVYDHYTICATDPGYNAKLESWQITYRPLFMTSFVLASFVLEQCAAKDTVILTSASSKTAYGTAILLKNAHTADKPLNVVGLTSKGNKDFVTGLGCYDQVVEYDDISSMTLTSNAIVLDFAGNKQTLINLQDRLTTQLMQTYFIGATDVQSKAHDSAVEGTAKGEVFFAPSHVKARQKEWGTAEFFSRYQQAWIGFMKRIAPVIKEQTVIGMTAIQSAYAEALAGHLDASKMLILKPE